MAGEEEGKPDWDSLIFHGGLQGWLVLIPVLRNMTFVGHVGFLSPPSLVSALGT